MRFGAPRQGSQIEDEIVDPDDGEQNVGVPFRFGVLLRLCDADQIAADRQDAKEIIADNDNPRAERVRQACPGCPLHHME